MKIFQETKPCQEAYKETWIELEEWNYVFQITLWLASCSSDPAINQLEILKINTTPTVISIIDRYPKWLTDHLDNNDRPKSYPYNTVGRIF